MKFLNTQYQFFKQSFYHLGRLIITTISFIVLLGVYPIYSQGGAEITIKVSDEKNAPLRDVIIRLPNSPLDRKTDASGRVKIQVENRANFDINQLTFIKKGKSVKSTSISPDNKEVNVMMWDTQENAGTLYDESGRLMSNTPVKFLDYNESVITAGTGKFTIHTPQGKSITQDSRFEVKGQAIAKNDIKLEPPQSNGTIRFSITYREPKKIVQTLPKQEEGITQYTFYLENYRGREPLANLKLIVDGTSYTTDSQGKIRLTKPTGKEIRPIISGDYQETGNDYDGSFGFIYLKKLETQIVKNDNNLKDDFGKLAGEFTRTQTLLEEKNKRIKAEIIRIESKINNDKTLSTDQRKRYLEVLNNLKETLARNEKAYSQIQQQSGLVLTQLQSLVALKADSLKYLKIEADLLEAAKQKLEEEKALLERDFRNKIILFSVIALVFAGAAIFLFLLSRRLDKQKKELAEILAQVQTQKLQIETQNTQLVAQKEEIERKNTRLEDLDREKNSLMNIVAHDLKAPLNKIAGAAQLLPNLGDLNEEQDEFVQMIRKVAFEGKKFIEDLLDINAIEQQKPEAINWEKLDLETFLTPVVSSYKQQAENKHIQLHFDHQLNTKIIDADRSYLTRILDNLVSNAIKFSPKDKNIYITAIENSHIVSISIKDEGPGISPEDQKKMFKKFQKLSARPTAGESSTGLGLSIIKTLVERMEGQIKVNSEVGKGTEFVIELPKERNSK
ncbi:MAG: ATP-binding protein [Thermoflexibacter sp.]|nr:ATP-binding protein [Thermoflexibacter sp.]